MSFLQEEIKDITERYENLEQEFITWSESFETIAEQKAFEIVCCNFEEFCTWYKEEEESPLSDSAFIEDSNFNEYLEKRKEDYNCFTGHAGDHGFIFSDGSMVSIPGDDHRIIDIDTWYNEQIITVHISDGDLTVRINDNIKRNQLNIIEDIVKDYSLNNIYYDVYTKDDKIKTGGTLEGWQIEELWEAA